ncbi:MAG: sensor histidine kinase [Gammaproteobacteria bacterium]|nr:sensor histidine kinase [Gammaproteobacteria bacterium]
MKYTPAHGRISVALSIDGQHARITVRDDGPGIPSALHQKVVQRFFRMDSSRNQSGNGLGLSMVAAVCKLHGARLDFDNLDPGLGVSLTFRTVPEALPRPARLGAEPKPNRFPARISRSGAAG